LQTRKSRGAIMLAPVIFALSLYAAAPAMAETSAFSTMAAVPAKVQGSMPGFTDTGLTQLVDACVAAAPVPAMMADAAHAGWHVQVDVGNVYTPRAATVVRATLLEGDHVVASRWKQTAGLDTAPRVAFCSTVSNLTQQLWASTAQH
jgi:hypothetical protein